VQHASQEEPTKDTDGGLVAGFANLSFDTLAKATSPSSRTTKAVRFTDVPGEQPSSLTLYGVSWSAADWRSLEPEQWYTETVLTMYAEWIRSFVIERNRTALRSRSVKILSPSVVQIVKDSEQGYSITQVAEAIGAQALSRYDYIFAILNTKDTAQTTQPTTRDAFPSPRRGSPGASSSVDGGTHWSLLLLSVSANRYMHFDSLNQHNIQEAQAFAERFSAALFPRGQGEAQLVKVGGTPQQSNSWDCGPIVCWLLKVMVTRMCEDVEWGQQEEKDYWSFGNALCSSDEARTQIRYLIQELSDLRTVLRPR
jgi:hypothetical protein